MSSSQEDHSEAVANPGWFRTTQWTSVLLAGGPESPQAQAALARLCQAYWYPLYSFIRRQGHSPEDAKDLAQGFFARLLEKNYLKDAHREKGKFRSFLLMALKRYMANEWDRANRHKRGGGHEIISLDGADTEARYLSEHVDNQTAEKLFEQRWAASLLDQVIRRLQTEMAAEGKEKLFQELRAFVSGGEAQTSYPETAIRLQMSEGTVRVNVHRLRQRYREILRLEIANTVDSPEAIDDEIRHLFAALS